MCAAITSAQTPTGLVSYSLHEIPRARVGILLEIQRGCAQNVGGCMVKEDRRRFQLDFGDRPSNSVQNLEHDTPPCARTDFAFPHFPLSCRFLPSHPNRLATSLSIAPAVSAGFERSDRHSSLTYQFGKLRGMVETPAALRLGIQLPTLRTLHRAKSVPRSIQA
jgi:hypothetical protein